MTELEDDGNSPFFENRTATNPRLANRIPGRFPKLTTPLKMNPPTTRDDSKAHIAGSSNAMPTDMVESATKKLAEL
eukprot:CAMPEP_0181124162 /NCGR_PEP_ID=MMETSP1071-20121207/26318_1 /TAXON_ID=35127 /ORGANISM="Thalassiosira sp., Strain NH16" /LENGTH=75 /DNA_ID=CAMNT_0023209417 /DNA_START=54 /DNA_END=282 /DNA_ORIENTATION=-